MRACKRQKSVVMRWIMREMNGGVRYSRYDRIKKERDDFLTFFHVSVIWVGCRIQNWVPSINRCSKVVINFFVSCVVHSDGAMWKLRFEISSVETKACGYEVNNVRDTVMILNIVVRSQNGRYWKLEKQNNKMVPIELKGCRKRKKRVREEVSYVLHSVEGTLSPVTQTGLKKGKRLSLRNGAIFCTLGPKIDGSEVVSNVNEMVNNTCIKSANVINRCNWRLIDVFFTLAELTFDLTLS